MEEVNYDSIDAELKGLGEEYGTLLRKIVEERAKQLIHFRVALEEAVEPFSLLAGTRKDALFADGFIYVDKAKFCFDSHADEMLAKSVLKNGDEMYFFKHRGFSSVARKDDYHAYLETQAEIEALEAKRMKIIRAIAMLEHVKEKETKNAKKAKPQRNKKDVQ